MVKVLGPSIDSQAPSWPSGSRTDVPAEYRVQKLTTSLLLGRLLATKAYVQKITYPKLSKL